MSKTAGHMLGHHAFFFLHATGPLHLSTGACTTASTTGKCTVLCIANTSIRQCAVPDMTTYV